MIGRSDTDIHTASKTRCVFPTPPPRMHFPNSARRHSMRDRYLIHVKFTPSLILFNSVATSTTQHEICALIGYYATYNGNSLRTFRDNLSRNVSKELPLMLRNIPERYTSQPLRGGRLKSRTKQPTNGPSVFRARCLLDRGKVIR